MKAVVLWVIEVVMCAWGRPSSAPLVASLGALSSSPSLHPGSALQRLCFPTATPLLRLLPYRHPLLQQEPLPNWLKASLGLLEGFGVHPVSPGPILSHMD